MYIFLVLAVNLQAGFLPKHKLNNIPTFELVNIHILNFVSFNLTEAGGHGGLGR